MLNFDLQRFGGGSWSRDSWTSYATSHVTSKASVDAIYSKSRSAHDIVKNGLCPKDVIRESRDSADNPESTAIIVGLDVTGSMGRVLDAMARKGLPTLAEELYSRKPVTNPHLMFMGVGDTNCDSAPLQVTQFEADIRIAEQLTNLYLERGGGGNDYESYILPWYFAAMNTSIDCFEKRGKKGYLFTCGDEMPTPGLKASHLEQFLGGQHKDYTAEEVYALVSRNYEVFHLIVKEGSFCRHHFDQVHDAWTDLIGQRALVLEDHTKMGEVIISAIQVNEGEDAKKVASSWDGSTNLVVAKAVEGLTSSVSKTASGLITFD